MSKDKYSSMNYSKLKELYAERCGYMGIANPSIPRKKKDLITMLMAADVLGVPLDGNTNPTESIRRAVIGILEKGIAEHRRGGKPEPVILIS